MKKNDLLISKVKNPIGTYVFAHGAGAPMDHEWMNEVTIRLTKSKVEVIRFEFPYMAERRQNDKKRPPNSKKILFECWNEVLEIVGVKNKLFIGGKSMGGRIASLIADTHDLAGVICLGFPFHAPGKAPGDRIEHLKDIKTRTLIAQGTRDSMGTREDVKSYNLSDNINIFWLEDGDHGLKPRKKSGLTHEEHLDSTVQAIVDFIKNK